MDVKMTIEYLKTTLLVRFKFKQVFEHPSSQNGLSRMNFGCFMQLYHTFVQMCSIKSFK